MVVGLNSGKDLINVDSAGSASVKLTVGGGGGQGCEVPAGLMWLL